MCANDDQTFWPLTTKWSPFELGPRAGAGEVGAGVGLREALAPDLLGREDLVEVPLLLRVGAVDDDRRAGHAEADHADVRRRRGGGHLLVEDRLVAVGRARAAVLLRPGQAGVAGVVELAAPLAAELLEPLRAAPAAALGLGQVRLDPRLQLGPELRLLRACRGGPRRGL